MERARHEGTYTHIYPQTLRAVRGRPGPPATSVSPRFPAPVPPCPPSRVDDGSRIDNRLRRWNPPPVPMGGPLMAAPVEIGERFGGRYVGSHIAGGGGM